MKKLDDSYTQALLEEIKDQNKVVMEYVKHVPKMSDDISKIEKRLSNVESDILVIKTAVQHTDKTVNLLDQRVTKLETTH